MVVVHTNSFRNNFGSSYRLRSLSVCQLALRMAARQELLRDAWRGGVDGHLSALTEARIWGLREAWGEFKDTNYGMLIFIATRVTIENGGNPWPSATQEFFRKVDVFSIIH